ncbi:MAG: molybdate ABC transporter substrate-binding protein [Pseudomonadota bacterium]
MPIPGRQLLLPATLLLLSACPAAAETVTVYAAASLTDALGEIAAAYEKEHDIDVRLSFAGSGTLAKQIGNGAPAQIFVSADRNWMDHLQERNLLARDSRHDLLGNALVLIAPDGQATATELQPGFDLPASFAGRLCTGDPASVPVGIHAKQALQKLGWWNGLKQRLVGTEDVRTALAFVERGECRRGIVYRTDARVSRRVSVIGEFPAGSHAPIVYPVALLPAATPAAREFFRHLDSAAARAVFNRHGFTPAP